MRPPTRLGPLLATLLVLGSSASPVAAQDDQPLVSAVRAFEGLDYTGAVEQARAALASPLSTSDRAVALEILGYSLGIMNQPDEAVQALSQMILLDPGREPDTQALPPRLVDLWNQALGQVLVVRGLLVDSTSFVSGDGLVTLHWETSRPADTELRVVGSGVDAVVHQRLSDPGPSRYDWTALLDATPLPEGDYRLVVTAREGRNEYQGSIPFQVAHAPVDTMAMLTSLPGFAKLPETEVPPRDWRPLGISTLLTGAVGGAALALNNSAFDGARWELGIGAVLSLGAGLAMSLRTPDARPVPAAIRYNELVDETLAERNAAIAQENEERRRRVYLTIQESGR